MSAIRQLTCVRQLSCQNLELAQIITTYTPPHTYNGLLKLKVGPTEVNALTGG